MMSKEMKKKPGGMDVLIKEDLRSYEFLRD